MTYYEWAEDLAIDHGPLDADHRLLIDQSNWLHDATNRGEGRAVVGNLMNQVLAATLEHVQREEHYMETLGYPRLDDHRRGHLRFVEELRFLQHRYQSGSIVVAAEFSTLLRDWLSLHVRRQDKDILFFQQSLERAQKRARSDKVEAVLADWQERPHEQRHFDRRHASGLLDRNRPEQRRGQRRGVGMMILTQSADQQDGLSV